MLQIKYMEYDSSMLCQEQENPIWNTLNIIEYFNILVSLFILNYACQLTIYTVT